MIISWLDDAIFDLKSLRQYIALENPIAANHVFQRIKNMVKLLSSQPEIGRYGRIPNTRELIVPNTPYIIPYRVKNNTIEIIRILHSAMEWPETL